MKKIKIAIVFIIIIILIIVGLLMILTKRKTNNSEINIINNNQDENTIEIVPTPASGTNTYNPDMKISEINSQIDYFNVKTIVEKYFYECYNLNIKDEDIVLPRTGINGDELKKYIAENKKELQSLAQKVLYNMLGKEYIKEFNITENNISNKLKIDYKNKIILNSIKKSDLDSRTSIYIVSGDMINIQKNISTEFKLMICMDATNQTYYIYPSEYLKRHGIDNKKDGDKLDIKIGEIKENIHNKYEIQTYSDELICKVFFADMKNRLLYVPDSLYNRLYSEYSQKRFKNIEDFRNYVKDRKQFFVEAQFKAYKVASIGNQKEYICIDQYNNYYIFKCQDGILNYSILLDDYTIMEGSEVIAYGKLDGTDKARYNSIKFLKMINHKDYNAIYNVLNKEFRNSNFKTVDDLKKFINNNFYEINDIKFEKIIEKDNYYLFVCKMSNLKNNKESKKINIIIGKTNDTNFEMSFSF